MHDDVLTKFSLLLQILPVLHPQWNEVGEDVVKDYMITQVLSLLGGWQDEMQFKNVNHATNWYAVP